MELLRSSLAKQITYIFMRRKGRAEQIGHVFNEAAEVEGKKLLASQTFLSRFSPRALAFFYS